MNGTSRRRTMTATLATHPGRRELDHRYTNGIDVTLSWCPADDRLFVTVLDDAGDPFELVVEARQALDAFHHPFAYAAAGPARVSRVLDAHALESASRAGRAEAL
jgi:hypothetical protein